MRSHYLHVLPQSSAGSYTRTILANIPQLKVLDDEQLEGYDVHSLACTSLARLSPVGCNSVVKGQRTPDELQGDSAGQWGDSSRLEDSSDLTHGQCYKKNEVLVTASSLPLPPPPSPTP